MGHIDRQCYQPFDFGRIIENLIEFVLHKETTKQKLILRKILGWDSEPITYISNIYFDIAKNYDGIIQPLRVTREEKSTFFKRALEENDDDTSVLESEQFSDSHYIVVIQASRTS